MCESDLLSRQVNGLFAAGYWARGRELLLEELEHDPDSHWLLDRIGHSFYEQREYAKALAYASAAHAIAPYCSMVTFGVASAYHMLERHREAAMLYGRIAEQDLQTLLLEPCSEGLQSAYQLKVDSHFRRGLCYLALGDETSAWADMHTYLQLWEADGESLESPDEARAILAGTSTGQEQLVEETVLA